MDECNGTNSTPLATEIYSDLKASIQFKSRLIWVLIGVIVALVIALAATNMYHIYQWSQFDTIVVDSGEGGGNANLVQGDNSGGIYNGTDSGENTEEIQQP